MKTAKIEALEKQIKSGKLNSDKARILEFAKRKKFFFIREVMTALNLSIRTASARISELEDLGLIAYQYAMKTKYAPDKQGMFKYLDDDGERRKHARKRHYDRRKKWLNYGEVNGFLDEDLNVVR